MDFKKLIDIGSELRDYLKEVERHFSIKMDDKLIEKILGDSQADQVTEKKYEIFDSKPSLLKSRLTINATVDAYEPETIWIEIKNIEKDDIQHFDNFVTTRTT